MTAPKGVKLVGSAVIGASFVGPEEVRRPRVVGPQDRKDDPWAKSPGGTSIEAGRQSAGSQRAATRRENKVGARGRARGRPLGRAQAVAARRAIKASAVMAGGAQEVTPHEEPAPR